MNLLEEFPGIEILENSFRYSPAGELHGELWVSGEFKIHDPLYFRKAVVDPSLPRPEILAQEIYGIRRREEAIEDAIRDFSYRRDLFESAAAMDYLLTKLMQTSSVSRFLWLLHELDYHSPMLRPMSNSNWVWYLAQRKGGDILRVMKNRHAGQALI